MRLISKDKPVEFGLASKVLKDFRKIPSRHHAFFFPHTVHHHHK
jgi:hypothetical protein